MHIVHFYGHEGANGVAWSILDTSRLLIERGHSVHVVCRTDSILKSFHARSTYLFAGRLHRPFLRRLLWRILQRQPVDVINIHSQRDAQLALEVAREAGVPTVYSCRALTFHAC